MSARVTILMAVYNGGAVLREQLDSFAAQDHARWRLLASDDGSSDNSRAVLAAFAAEGHDVTVLDGPGQGGTANFLSLVARAEEDGGWLAFSDQDDVWMPDRLSRGIAALEGLDGPALYCSRTWITGPDLKGRRLSPARPRGASFRNALVQNVVAGNTILLNAQAARLARAAVHEARRVVVHDWWLYQLVTGAGGAVVHDDRPTLYYRQHVANQIGANDTWPARIRRIRQLLRGDFRAWNAVNIAALSASAHRLTPENRARLDAFADLHAAGPLRRLAALRRLRLYRQSWPAQAALWLAALLGRM